MNYLIAIFISLAILGLVLLVLSLVRTPHYQLDREAVLRFLSLVVNGQASDNDWSVFTSVPIRHDAQLERVRLRCVELEQQYYLGSTRSGHLLSAEGIEHLQALLETLQSQQD
ncbi:MAG: hypothetical protein OIF35_05830 [Cellvibrionaceae bacterium]|nr:hypothetical protein [Cellvibrionaceae bacterium]